MKIFSNYRRGGFTVLELLVVIAIIIALAALILATVGYAQKKGARARAETEIAGMTAALESYKADNGDYPTSAATDGLSPATNTDPRQSVYMQASLFLYEELSGDRDNNRQVNASDDKSGAGLVPKTYFVFKSSQLQPAPPSTLSVTALRDPFGNSYGYSTAKKTTPTGTAGYNPTFDLWSTGGDTSGQFSQWIKNW